MKTSSIAAIAGFTGLASANGVARVLNGCDETVFIDDCPSVGAELFSDLVSGGEYHHEWAVLSTGGWSMKMSHVKGSFANNILQYEWNLDMNASPAKIWWDMSNVNGFLQDANGNSVPWEPFTTNKVCTAAAVAYDYPTDDRHGMQGPCTDLSVDITILLCNSTSLASELKQNYTLGSVPGGGDASGSASISSVGLSTYAAPTATSPASSAALSTHEAAETTAAASTSAEASPTVSAATYQNVATSAQSSVDAPASSASVYQTVTDTSDDAATAVVTEVAYATDNVVVTVHQTQTQGYGGHGHGGHRRRHAHRRSI